MSTPAEAYENYIVPALFDPWARELVQRVPPADSHHVLDVACGTGIVARRAAEMVGAKGKVAGVDPNPGMIAVARAAAEREGCRIDWHEGPAEHLPFEDASFNRVYCQQGLQFFADRQAGINEMARVLAPGGHVAVATWQPLDRHEFFNALHAAMQRRLGSPAASAPFTLGDPGELSSLLNEAGLNEVEVTQLSRDSHYPDPERFLSETLTALMAVVTSMLDIDKEELQAGFRAVAEDLRGPLSQFTHGDEVVLSWHGNIATGVR